MGNGVIARAARGLMMMVVLSAIVAGLAPTGMAQERIPVSDALCAVLPASGAAEVCADYFACIAADPNAYLVPQACDQSLYGTLLAGCAATGECAADILFSAAMTQMAADNIFDGYEPENFHAALIDISAAFRAADASLLSTHTTNAYASYPHRLLPYVAGLGHAQFGSGDLALAHFAEAVNTQFNTPLAFYSRGYLHAAHGQDDMASQDFYTFAALQGEDAPVRYGLSVPAVTADEVLPDAEAFVLYPIASYGFSPGGEFVAYTFDAPAVPVTMSLSTDETTLAVQGLTPASFEMPIPDVLFFTCTDAVCTRTLSLQQSFLGLSPAGSIVRITIGGDYLEIEEDIMYSEAGVQTLGVLLPEGVNDPRLAVTCPGGAYALLEEGMEVISNPFWMSTTLYAAPGVSSEVIAQIDSGTFTVTGSLTCAEGGNWWPVSTVDGVTGWVSDTSGGLAYTLLPADWFDRARPTVAELLELP
ncbi:MAG: SH3 domain-containing protein [Pleurocapsa minor GSE-CHR-MK-17-07R]|nr:SH3 domain-containing protein [Pleurocapsa minor GSE-CHR-MK 17-07R]